MAGRSPPGPFMCGSTTCSVSPVATAASNALPPPSSTRIPTADASQCVEATMPKVPTSSGRAVKGVTAIRGPPSPGQPLGAEARADVDVDLAQRAVAGVDEAVRRVGRDDRDLAGPDHQLLVAHHERAL